MEGALGLCGTQEDGLAECLVGQCSRSGRGGIILVHVGDVLEFMLVTESSRSKLQTAQFDDGGYDGVLVVATRALVIEIVDAEDRESRRWNFLCAA